MKRIRNLALALTLVGIITLLPKVFQFEIPKIQSIIKKNKNKYDNQDDTLFI